jgi:hypothetical protein
MYSTRTRCVPTGTPGSRNSPFSFVSMPLPVPTTETWLFERGRCVPASSTLPCMVPVVCATPGLGPAANSAAATSSPNSGPAHLWMRIMVLLRMILSNGMKTAEPCIRSLQVHSPVDAKRRVVTSDLPIRTCRWLRAGAISHVHEIATARLVPLVCTGLLRKDPGVSAAIGEPRGFRREIPYAIDAMLWGKQWFAGGTTARVLARAAGRRAGRRPGPCRRAPGGTSVGVRRRRQITLLAEQQCHDAAPVTGATLPSRACSSPSASAVRPPCQ